MSDQKATKSPASTGPVKVRLLKLHQHEGKDRKPGDVITASPVIAKWLADQGVGEVIKDPTATA